MMEHFTYLAAASSGEAIQFLAERGRETKVLAGGTDLLVQLKEQTARPESILDISGLDELRGIRAQHGYLWIGPLTTHHELSLSGKIREHAPALAEGAGMVGCPQIRHRGTIGGNLANASPAADTVPALMVLQAEVEIRSTEGSGWVPVSSFFQGPAQTILQPQELITGLKIPLSAGGSSSRYQKFGSRNALSIALASVAVALERDGSGQMTAARIALGSVSPTVIRATAAEEMLTGQFLEEDLIARAAASASEQCCPIDDVRASAWYRRQLVRALLTKALRSWSEND